MARFPALVRRILCMSVVLVLTALCGPSQAELSDLEGTQGHAPSDGLSALDHLALAADRLDAARALEATRPVERLCFLQVELGEQDTPTYQFVPGVAPTSLANQVASRLGVTREELEALVEQREASFG